MWQQITIIVIMFRCIITSLTICASSIKEMWRYLRGLLAHNMFIIFVAGNSTANDAIILVLNLLFRLILNVFHWSSGFTSHILKVYGASILFDN